MAWSPHRSFLGLSALSVRLSSASETGALPTPGEMSWKIFDWLSLQCLPSLPFRTKPLWLSHQSHLDEGQ